MYHLLPPGVHQWTLEPWLEMMIHWHNRYTHAWYNDLSIYTYENVIYLYACIYIFFYNAKLTHETVWYLSFHFYFDLFLLIFLFLEACEDMNLLCFCLKYHMKIVNKYDVLFFKQNLFFPHSFKSCCKQCFVNTVRLYMVRVSLHCAQTRAITF